VNTILDRIVASKRKEIEAAKAWTSADTILSAAAAARPVRDFSARLRGPGPIRLIAEVKKASPSAGVLRETFDPVAIARAYQAHGAACLSVLTDEPFFQGSLDHLRQIRAAATIPVLRKDFILDRHQLYEARAAGADAILLIAECLDDETLRQLIAETVQLGMTPLVEFYEPANAGRVLDAGATVIGVNNRDLKTFQVDLGHTIRMRERIPADCLLVGESGIRTHADLQRLEAAGVDAVLVGEGLVRQSDIGAAVDRLLGNGR